MEKQRTDLGIQQFVSSFVDAGCVKRRVIGQHDGVNAASVSNAEPAPESDSRKLITDQSKQPLEPVKCQSARSPGFQQENRR